MVVLVASWGWSLWLGSAVSSPSLEALRLSKVNENNATKCSNVTIFESKSWMHEWDTTSRQTQDGKIIYILGLHYLIEFPMQGHIDADGWHVGFETQVFCIMLCGFEHVYRKSIYREQPFRKPDKRWLLYMGHCINWLILCDTLSWHWFFHIVLIRECYVLCVLLLLFHCLVCFYLTTPIYIQRTRQRMMHMHESLHNLFSLISVLYMDVHAIDTVGLCCVVCDMICFVHAVFSCFVLYV